VHDGMSNMSKVYCSECKNVVDSNIVLPINSVIGKNSKHTFTVSGFSNWKKTFQRFSHHISVLHAHRDEEINLNIFAKQSINNSKVRKNIFSI